MRYGIHLSTATLIATASVGFVPTAGGATDRVAPPEADLRSTVPHLAPPEADALAAQAALDDQVTSPPPALARAGDGFDYTDGAIGAAVTAGTGIILIGLAGIRRRRKLVLPVR